MSHFIFETPWYAFGLLAVVLLALVLVLRNNQRPLLFGLAIFVLLLLPIPFLLDHFITTPGEEVNLLLDDLVAAARAGNSEAIVAALAPNYAHGGETYSSLAALVRREIGEIKFQSIQLNGRSVAVEDQKATAAFVAVIAGSSRGYGIDHYPIRLTLTVEKTPAGWKITRIQRFEPVVNTTEEIPLGRR